MIIAKRRDYKDACFLKCFLVQYNTGVLVEHTSRTLAPVDRKSSYVVSVINQV